MFDYQKKNAIIRAEICSQRNIPIVTLFVVNVCDDADGRQ